MNKDVANENTTRWHQADPDFNYVTEYMEKALAHFRDCKVAPVFVSMALTDAIIKLLPGKPYDKLPDEGDLREATSYLTPTIHELESRKAAYYRAIARVEQHRLEQLMERHGCTIEEAYQIWVASENDPTVLRTGLPETTS